MSVRSSVRTRSSSVMVEGDVWKEANIIEGPTTTHTSSATVISAECKLHLSVWLVETYSLCNEEGSSFLKFVDTRGTSFLWMDLPRAVGGCVNYHISSTWTSTLGQSAHKINCFSVVCIISFFVYFFLSKFNIVFHYCKTYMFSPFCFAFFYMELDI